MDQGSLDRSLVQGVAWTSGVKWGVQILTWASTILVMRLLTPQDYGLVGMASLFLGLVTLVSEFGIGSAVVALRELSQEQIAQINSVSILLGLSALAMSSAAAWPVADFFDSPRLMPVILALSTTFLFSAFTVVPGAVLRRDLRYRTLAFLDASQAVVGAASTLLLAWLGFGYWSLVLGRLASFVVGALAFVIVTPQRFNPPRFHQIRQAMTFSFHVIAGRVGWYAYSNADYLVVGKILGQGPLGLYTAAFTLSRVPIEKITAMVAQVSPGIFSAVQEDFNQLRRYVLLLTETIALVTFPALIGLGLVAPEAVRVMLGSNWIGAVTVLQILSIGAAINSVTPVLPQVLNVIRETRYSMHVTLVAAGIFIVGFLLGVRWGIEGVALAWVVLHPITLFVPNLMRIRTRIQLSFRAYGAALWPAVSATVVMAATVLLTRALLSPSFTPSLLLTTEVVVGVATYVSFILTVHRVRARRLLGAVRLLRG